MNENRISNAAAQQSADDRSGLSAAKRCQAWKGLEPAEPVLQLTRPARKSSDTDMTSMVDVTFLLLIFFMVTASFTVQKALASPPTFDDRPSQNSNEQIDADPAITILVDEFNTFVLRCDGHEEVEAASDPELRVRLVDLRDSSDAKRVVILADSEAWHEKVVTAWDAANTAKFQQIQIGMSD